jgi:hypothetical protein
VRPAGAERPVPKNSGPPGTLEQEEGGCALDVSQVAGARVEQALELRPREGQRGDEAQQLLAVALDGPEQGDDVARGIVDHLHLSPSGPREEHPAHAGERLGVAGVLHGIDPGGQAPGEVALAAGPGGEPRHRDDGFGAA